MDFYKDANPIAKPLFNSTENLKLLIVLNGRGGVGKDTLAEIVSKYFKVRNRSSITPIKEIASTYAGWNGGKTDKDRKFLSDLKALFTDYCELPNNYLLKEYREFMEDKEYPEEEEQVMFAHIREPREIEKFVKLTDHKAITLLIKGRKDNEVYGNHSDDDVENYSYDYTYENNKPLDKVEADFMNFFRNLIESEKLKEFPHDFEPNK